MKRDDPVSRLVEAVTAWANSDCGATEAEAVLAALPPAAEALERDRRDWRHLLDNLTATQTRCTELLEELRAARRTVNLRTAELCDLTWRKVPGDP
jgi:hypothetical protein